MKKCKLVVSDFHLGTGRRLSNGTLNPLEDFLHDQKFAEFLAYYSRGEYADCDVELIFNGDMLNMTMTDYHGHFPVILTEKVAVSKVQSIINGHPLFFDALKRFLSHPNHSLTFVVGNHDQEMLWKKAREVFEARVGAPILWKNFHYQVDGIHIEHGHQYEAANRVDPARPFLSEGLPEPILNLPWGTLFTIQYIVRLKLSRPAIDKIRPFRNMIWWSLFHDTWMTLRSLFALFSYFISTRFSKNRYRQSNLGTTLKILFEANVFPDLTDAAKRILRSPAVNSVIFGHSHVYKHVLVGGQKQYFNTGTWNEIVSMDLESFARRSRLTYVRVEYDPDGKPQPLLRHWIGTIPVEDDALM